LKNLLTKDAAFWKPDCKNAFDQLREYLLREPVLKHHDSSLPTRIETDSSAYAVGSVLKQERLEGWHAVAYLSRTMTSAERNYPIQEQEQVALIYALKKLRHCFFGT
jgi:hypothetical protein